jgi:hypothetical protein
MNDKRRQVSDALAVELVAGTQPALLITRGSGGRVRVEFSEVKRLAEILGNVAADLAGYQVGDHLPDERGGDDWRRLIGQVVRVPGGRRGMVMGPVGDWSKSFERGCLLVSFSDKAPEVHNLSDVELARKSDRRPVSVPLSS